MSGNLDREQNRVSSGLRVSQAADDAAYWSISTTLKSDKKAHEAVLDSLGLADAVVDTAYLGMQNSIDVVDEIKKRLVMAREPAADRNKINAEITELKQEIRTIAEASSFGGQNWLFWNGTGDSRDKEMVSGYVRNDRNQVAVTTFGFEVNTPPPLTSTDVQYIVDNGGDGEYGILTSAAFALEAGASQNYVLLQGLTNTATTVDMVVAPATTYVEIDEMISTVDLMSQKMMDVAATFGAIQQRVSTQSDFTKTLMGVSDKGVGRLIDAEMNETSARLKALQTQQQLGQSALSVANASGDNITRLYQ